MGLVSLLQDVPLYRMMVPGEVGGAAVLSPTATQKLLDTQETLLRFFVVGEVVATQLVPFHWWIDPPSPTATQKLVLVHEILFLLFEKLVNKLQLVPFHRYIFFKLFDIQQSLEAGQETESKLLLIMPDENAVKLLPFQRYVAELVPTAQQSVALKQVTSLKFEVVEGDSVTCDQVASAVRL